MKLNSFQKNLYIFFSVIISILVVTLLWEKITLPLSGADGARGMLASKAYNPINDTIRYIFFIALPLIVYLFLNQLLKKQTIRVKELIFEKDEKVINCHPILIILSLIFIIFIFFEFFSINFSFPNYTLDHFHDGNYLTPAQNYLSTENIWTASYLTHGASDIFYPIVMWKIFGVKSIGATRTFPIFLILFIKLLCVLLSYQLTKISKLNKDIKILFFTIFTSILLSMSHYTFLGAGYYFSHKDIYIILFLIFFIELFVHSKFRSLFTILICLIATASILLQIDRGAYIYFVLFFYFLYLLIAKKYNETLLIFFTLIICWIIAINLIGFEEFQAYLENTKAMAISGELIHGLKYPEPFFSIGDNPNGARATKALLLQLTAGIFILNYLISNKNKIFSSKKVLFVFLFLLIFIMYKDALGRSDSAHIRGSHDLPILINCFFILNYLLIFLEKILLGKKFLNYKVFFTLSTFFLLFYYGYNHNHYNIDNIKNYKKNFISLINLKDEVFLDQKTIKLIKYYKQISKEDHCIENITYDDAIPYLLKKPSCTKYWASWLASPVIVQKDYINEIKKIRPKYILYPSASHKFDGLEIYERIELVNSYVLSNYKRHKEFGDYIFLEKK